MYARYLKIGLWTVALCAVWELGRSDVIPNAVFLFVTAGVVPGTGVVLSPNQVFWLLGAVLVLSLVLIFASELRRGVLALFGRRPSIENDMPEPTIVVEIRPQRAPGLIRRSWWRLAAALRLRKERTTLFLETHFPRLAAAALRLWRRIEITCATAWVLTQPYLQRAGAAVRRALIRFAVIVGVLAVRAWRWAEPHIRRFDAWLGVQLHRGLKAAGDNEGVKAGVAVLREVGKVTSSWRDGIRAALGRVVEK